jgi:membrane protein implicated in regulation of membrane protease activity
VPLHFWSWLVVALVCAVYELYGAEMLSLPFALGALAAAVAVLVGAGPWWQWGLFFAVALIALLGFARWWRAPAQGL